MSCTFMYATGVKKNGVDNLQMSSCFIKESLKNLEKGMGVNTGSNKTNDVMVGHDT